MGAEDVAEKLTRRPRRCLARDHSAIFDRIAKRAGGVVKEMGDALDRDHCLLR